jgi:subtilisin-like proprotein convertase family protein
MKLFVFLFFFLPFSSFSQVIFSQGGAITDFNGIVRTDTFRVQVNNVKENLSPTFGLSKVCINIYHEKISDLKIEILAPDGTRVWLTNRNGDESATLYFNTCFASNGFSGFVHQGKYPFTGEYIPDGRLEFINNGQNPNGEWKILIADLREGNTGSLNYFSLQFEKDPNPNSAQSGCSETNPAACKCPDGTLDCVLLPDLAILERFTQSQIKEYAFDDKEYPGQLRFAATIANIGSGPIEVSGNNQWFCGDQKVEGSLVCPNGEYSRQKLTQKVYELHNQKISSTLVETGSNYYDSKPGHNHFHVDSWVEFRLLKKTFFNKRKIICEGTKVSYCLFDNGICNGVDSLCKVQGQVYTSQNLLNYGFGSFVDCKSGNQGISVGGYDTYGILYEGQYLDLPKNLKNGVYTLEIEIDPEKKYKESNRKNNTYSQEVTISKQNSKGL